MRPTPSLVDGWIQLRNIRTPNSILHRTINTTVCLSKGIQVKQSHYRPRHIVRFLWDWGTYREFSMRLRHISWSFHGIEAHIVKFPWDWGTYCEVSMRLKHISWGFHEIEAHIVSFPWDWGTYREFSMRLRHISWGFHGIEAHIVRFPWDWGTYREVSMRLRLPDFKKKAHESSKVSIPTYRPPLPPQEIFLVLISVRGWVNHSHRAARRIMSMRNFNDAIGNRNRDLPASTNFATACSKAYYLHYASPFRINTRYNPE
jgi:hypothetical protein